MLSFSQQGNFIDWSPNICSKAVKAHVQLCFQCKNNCIDFKAAVVVISKSCLHFNDFEKTVALLLPQRPLMGPRCGCFTSAACEDTGLPSVHFVHIQRQRKKVAENPSTGMRWESPKCRCNLGWKTKKPWRGKYPVGTESAPLPPRSPFDFCCWLLSLMFDIC